MKKAKSKKPAPDSIRIPPAIKELALKRCDEENRTLSNLIITALKEYLK